MIDYGAHELEYKGYHAHVIQDLDEWIGEIIETCEEIYARTLEEIEDEFHEAVHLYSILARL